MGFLRRLGATGISIGMALLVYALIVRPWFMHWGATPAEIAASDSTDLLVASSVESPATRAITIHAPRATVWSWIAQVGQGKGGFYSYDILENVIFHCDIHSVDRIDPRFQHPHTGDEFH